MMLILNPSIACSSWIIKLPLTLSMWITKPCTSCSLISLRHWSPSSGQQKIRLPVHHVSPHKVYSQDGAEPVWIWMDFTLTSLTVSVKSLQLTNSFLFYFIYLIISDMTLSLCRPKVNWQQSSNFISCKFKTGLRMWEPVSHHHETSRDEGKNANQHAQAR